MSRKVSKNYNSLLIEQLSEKPIAFNPALARLAKSAGAGLFLSQLLYWWGKGRKPDWIYKTISEIQEETSLTRSEQDRAIRKWKELGVLVVEKRGIPPTRHFKINIPRLLACLEAARVNRASRANRSAGFSRSFRSNMQNTTESTHENTSRDIVLQTCNEKPFDFKAARENLYKKLSMDK